MMDIEILKARVKSEWLKDKTVNIPLKALHLQQGGELMKEEMKKAIEQYFTDAVERKPKGRGFTRGMFGIDEQELLKLIDKL